MNEIKGVILSKVIGFLENSINSLEKSSAHKEQLTASPLVYESLVMSNSYALSYINKIEEIITECGFDKKEFWRKCGVYVADSLIPQFFFIYIKSNPASFLTNFLSLYSRFFDNTETDF